MTTRGYKYSDEQRARMSKAQKGIRIGTKIHTEESRRVLSQKMKVIRLNHFRDNPEARKKLSDSKKDERSPSWKGGISMRWLRKQTLERDKYKCQWCGLCDTEIVQMDHIQPKQLRPDLTADLKNLTTLCPNCHHRKTKVDNIMIAIWKRNHE